MDYVYAVFHNVEEIKYAKSFVELQAIIPGVTMQMWNNLQGLRIGQSKIISGFTVERIS